MCSIPSKEPKEVMTYDRMMYCKLEILTDDQVNDEDLYIYEDEE